MSVSASKIQSLPDFNYSVCLRKPGQGSVTSEQHVDNHAGDIPFRRADSYWSDSDPVIIDDVFVRIIVERPPVGICSIQIYAGSASIATIDDNAVKLLDIAIPTNFRGELLRSIPGSLIEAQAPNAKYLFSAATIIDGELHYSAQIVPVVR